ncbi:DNA-binding transcriptional ArsR family regulator [Sphingomonas naasensis]|uniref:ArsR family transcriptional regulator n=1 Tax=Sphingomonas naasensis TaxID=1344951 RepID=A0A4S1WSK1_9SPHN|nr:metalloregulator ArsR/SmtB family transcription factor [Sphingomonas naasensis]NIJ20233.1 DNA-binding transcriptional ArsR family regulator [Sphingomonas naasensis]TGX44376.1 ArsR family transcriptional regulator [Sphingomonas naasensis]
MTASIDRLFHALGDPTRRAIVDQLTAGPQSVSGLSEPLGITLTAVSQHLQILEQCDVVVTEKSGRVRIASLVPDGLRPLETWARQRRSRLERQLDRLGEWLEQPER